MTNAELVESVLARDEDGWNEFVDRYNRLVWHVVRCSAVRAPETQDVVQVVFLRLADRLTTLRDPEKLTGFVASVARLTSMESFRSSMRRKELEDRLTSKSPERFEREVEDVVVQSSQVDAALRGLARLSADCQQLLRMAFGLDMTALEISNVIGIDPGAVRVRKSRCLDRLRDTPEVLHLLESNSPND